MEQIRQRTCKQLLEFAEFEFERRASVGEVGAEERPTQQVGLRAAMRAGSGGGGLAESAPARANQLLPERELLRAAAHHFAFRRIQLK